MSTQLLFYGLKAGCIGCTQRVLHILISFYINSIYQNNRLVVYHFRPGSSDILLIVPAGYKTE